MAIVRFSPKRSTVSFVFILLFIWWPMASHLEAKVSKASVRQYARWNQGGIYTQEGALKARIMTYGARLVLSRSRPQR